jgi:hypothetical protein
MFEVYSRYLAYRRQVAHTGRRGIRSERDFALAARGVDWLRPVRLRQAASATAAHARRRRPMRLPVLRLESRRIGGIGRRRPWTPLAGGGGRRLNLNFPERESRKWESQPLSAVAGRAGASGGGARARRARGVRRGLAMGDRAWFGTVTGHDGQGRGESPSFFKREARVVGLRPSNSAAPPRP